MSKFEIPVYQSPDYDLKLSLGWVRSDGVDYWLTCKACDGTGEDQGGFGSLSMPEDACPSCNGFKKVKNPDWKDIPAPPFPDDLWEHLINERDKFIKERIENPRRYLKSKGNDYERRRRYYRYV